MCYHGKPPTLLAGFLTSETGETDTDLTLALEVLWWKRRNRTEKPHRGRACVCSEMWNTGECGGEKLEPLPNLPLHVQWGAWNLGRALKTFCLLGVQRVCGGVLAATDRRGRGRCMAKREPQPLQAQPEEDFAELAEASPEMWACSAVGGRVKKLVSTACGLTSHCCAVPS